ncbi:hypothetical protein [Helicobacter cappadocius]|uniref:Uncharacterized protein n=1 Tax=Helicobacter cappadocius TaxID=3063998 RepID=A0AA90PYZ0_9HELI|nr:MULTISPECIES: hypothetical protein [unclassified Helicobacter]MDO7253239.1 hypothetical protein [Helicobacter sp. faydin-H75]MDP2539163.1 hypothetical protein [Helicobacter sp. faydin-H76]
MKAIFLFLVLMSSFVFATDIKAQSCDDKSENSSLLKGSFLNKDKLVGQSCENRVQSFDDSASSTSPNEEKKLSDLKNFVNSSK